jgi:hypothetical protein
VRIGRPEHRFRNVGARMKNVLLVAFGQPSSCANRLPD